MRYFAMLCASALFWGASAARAQTYHFAAHGGGSKKDEFLDFAVDAAGNSYLLFKYEGNVNVAGNAHANPSKNTLLTRFDASGGLALTKDIVAEWPNFLFGALGVSDDGVVVTAARTKAGVLDGHAVYAGNFIGKLGGNGVFEWVLQPVDRVEGARLFNEFRVTAIEVVQDAIYVAATADGRVILNGVSDPGFAIDNQQSALLIKMDLDGNVAWIRHIPTPDVDNHPTIEGGMDHILPSADGRHVYVAGKVGDGSYNPYAVAYVAKFQLDGGLVWLRKTSTSGADSWGIAEASNGDLVTGFGVGGPQVIDFGGGARLEESPRGWIGAVARFDKNGNIITLKYVADALLEASSPLTASNHLRFYHLMVGASDQVVLLGKLVGQHTLSNGLQVASASGLLGTSEDAAIIVCDLDFLPIEAHANTGSNNEVAHKGALRDGTLYFAGEYDSYTHPFFGNFGPEFGSHAFVSAGDQDLFVTSLGLPVLGSPLAVSFHANPQENVLTLSWPARFSEATLNVSTSLAPGSWSDPGLSPSLESEQWSVTIPLAGAAGFYRLSVPGTPQGQ